MLLLWFENKVLRKKVFQLIYGGNSQLRESFGKITNLIEDNRTAINVPGKPIRILFPIGNK